MPSLAGQVPNEAGEENIAAQETVKKPQLKEIPFMQVRLAFEGELQITCTSK